MLDVHWMVFVLTPCYCLYIMHCNDGTGQHSWLVLHSSLTRMMASIGPTKNQITPFTLVDIQQLEVSVATMMTSPLKYGFQGQHANLLVRCSILIQSNSQSNGHKNYWHTWQWVNNELTCCAEIILFWEEVLKFLSPQPISRKNHHFLDSVLKTITNMRKSMMPSHNIQQNTARKR